MLSLKVAAYFSAVYQLLTHYNWWSGFFDSFIMILWHHRPLSFSKEMIKASDGETYAIWTPKTQTSLYHDAAIMKHHQSKRPHIWICLPGGMESIDPAMTALHSFDTFKGSKICMFNNPGISTNMVNTPLVSPTEPKYLIDYIRYLQNVYNYDVSLIGFSIGTVHALRAVHTICNHPEKYNGLKLTSVILVHGPDKVREAVCSFQQNWLFRMDLYFALHIQRLHYMSNSWNMIKPNVSKYPFEGWSYIEEVTSVTLNKEWSECEEEYFNLRRFCDESIECVPVLRIIAKNDFVVPFESIDEKYFKHLKQVLISERGGHCGVSRCNKTLEAIAKWNDDIIQNANVNEKVHKQCLDAYHCGSIAC